MERLKNSIKRIKWDSVLKAIFAIAIGVILIASPLESANFLYRIAGIILIAIGAVSVVHRFMTNRPESGASLIGVAFIMLGLYSAIHPEKMTIVQNIIFGIFLVIDGVLILENAILCARNQVNGWIYILIVAVVIIAIGIFVMLSSYAFTMTLAGIAMVFDGLCDLIIIGVFGKKISNIYHAIFKH